MWAWRGRGLAAGRGKKASTFFYFFFIQLSKGKPGLHDVGVEGHGMAGAWCMGGSKKTPIFLIFFLLNSIIQG